MDTNSWYNDLFSLFGLHLHTKKMVKWKAVSKQKIPIYSQKVEGKYHIKMLLILSFFFAQKWC